jgi:hypothetical protein
MFQDLLRVAYRLHSGWYDTAALAALATEVQPGVLSSGHESL